MSSGSSVCQLVNGNMAEMKRSELTMNSARTWQVIGGLPLVCLGFTAVVMTEVFSELEKRNEEVRTSRLVILDLS